MKNIEKLLHNTWLDGFKNGLHPGDKPDAFDDWLSSVDLQTWIIDGLAAKKDDKIFELSQDLAHQRSQVTYLQEQLSLVEDELATAVRDYEAKINNLENEMGRDYGNR